MYIIGASCTQHTTELTWRLSISDLDNDFIHFRQIYIFSPVWALNVFTTGMTGQMDLNTDCRCRVFPQCELINVSLTVENLQSFLYTRTIEMVTLQNELVNVNANYLIGQTTLYIKSSWMVSLQCELLNVNANEMIGKTTLYNGSRYRVSHQYELLNVSASL